MLLKKNSITDLRQAYRVLSWCIIDGLRSMTNSKGMLLCPSACIHFPPHYTHSVTSLPLSIFCREIKKICHLRETHHQIHCTFSMKQLVVSIRKTKWHVIAETPLQQPDCAAISLLCCACAQAAPVFHLCMPQAGRGHCVCSKPSAGPSSREALSCRAALGELLGVGGVAPHLPDTPGACSAFQHSCYSLQTCLATAYHSSKWLQAVCERCWQWKKPAQMNENRSLLQDCEVYFCLDC